MISRLAFSKGTAEPSGFFFVEESVMVLLDVTSRETLIPRWRMGTSGAFPAASGPLSFLGF